MRVQGGFFGILAALETGRLDPFDGRLPEERIPRRIRGLKRREMIRRDRARIKALARWLSGW